MKAGFIVSTGRTGTDFFTHLFNNYIPNAWSLHEPSPAFKRRSFELVSRDYTTYEKYYFKVPRMYRHLLREEETYLESNYHLFSVIPLIREVFPRAVVVHVVRDGRDVVRSWLNRGWFLDDPGSKLTPFYFDGHEGAKQNWDRWNALQKITWYWKTVNREIETRSPDITVHFEDVFYGDHQGLHDVLAEFEDLEYSSSNVEKAFEKKVNRTTHELIPEYAEWPSVWKDQFWEIAGDAMLNWGYESSEAREVVASGP